MTTRPCGLRRAGNESACSYLVTCDKLRLLDLLTARLPAAVAAALGEHRFTAAADVPLLAVDADGRDDVRDDPSTLCSGTLCLTALLAPVPVPVLERVRALLLVLALALALVVVVVVAGLGSLDAAGAVPRTDCDTFTCSVDDNLPDKHAAHATTTLLNHYDTTTTSTSNDRLTVQVLACNMLWTSC